MKKLFEALAEWFYFSNTRIILDIIVGFLISPYILLKKPRKKRK